MQSSRVLVPRTSRNRSVQHLRPSFMPFGLRHNGSFCLPPPPTHKHPALCTHLSHPGCHLTQPECKVPCEPLIHNLSRGPCFPGGAARFPLPPPLPCFTLVPRFPPPPAEPALRVPLVRLAQFRMASSLRATYRSALRQELDTLHSILHRGGLCRSFSTIGASHRHTTYPTSPTPSTSSFAQSRCRPAHRTTAL